MARPPCPSSHWNWLHLDQLAHTTSTIDQSGATIWQREIISGAFIAETAGILRADLNLHYSTSNERRALSRGLPIRRPLLYSAV